MSFGTLSIIYPDRQQQTMALTTATLRIGRADDNDLVLNDASVSRYHAQLVCDTSGCQIVDLGSANGTLIAGVRLTPQAPQPVGDGAQLQIGNISLHFRSMAPYVAPTTPAAVPSSMPPSTASVPPVGVAPASVAAPQVRVTLDPAQVVLEAGGAAVVMLQIINTGTVVDHYSVQVDGWNDAWLAAAPTRLPLLPDVEGVISLTFRPPRASEAYAQQGSVTINVWSEHHRAAVFSAQLPLTIVPFSDFALQAEPARVITRGRADYQLTLHNRGNSAQTFALRARDDADRVQCALDQASITVGPGQSVQTKLHAHAGSRPWSGPPQMYMIHIAAEPVDVHGQLLAQSSTPSALQGGAQVQLVQNARLPAWAIPMALVAMMLLCGGGAWAANEFWNVRPNENRALALRETEIAIQERMARASEAEKTALARELEQNRQQQTQEAQTQTAQAAAQTQTAQAAAQTQTAQVAQTQTAQATAQAGQAATTQTAQAATQTALAQPTATSTPTVSVTPGATGSGAGGTNGFVLVPPVIDGVFNPEEWSNLQPVGALPGGSVSFANDTDTLYLLLDITEDTGDDPFLPGDNATDAFTLTLDVNRNNELERGLDVMYLLDKQTRQLVVATDFTGTNSQFSLGRAEPGFDATSNAPTPHRFWECKIPLSELNVQAGQAMGIGVQIVSSQPPINPQELQSLLPLSLAQRQ